jgi:hypothetical protein
MYAGGSGTGSTGAYLGPSANTAELITEDTGSAVGAGSYTAHYSDGTPEYFSGEGYQ